MIYLFCLCRFFSIFFDIIYLQGINRHYYQHQDNKVQQLRNHEQNVGLAGHRIHCTKSEHCHHRLHYLQEQRQHTTTHHHHDKHYYRHHNKQHLDSCRQSQRNQQHCNSYKHLKDNVHNCGPIKGIRFVCTNYDNYA